MAARDAISSKFSTILLGLLAVIIVANPLLFSYNNTDHYFAAASGEKEELLQAISEFEDWAAEARHDAEEEEDTEALGLIEEADSFIELARTEADADNIDRAWEYLDQADEILNEVDEMLYGPAEPVQDCIPAGDSVLEPGNWTSVDSFAYQLQGINLQKMAETGFDLVIIDYSSDGSDEGRFSESQIECLQDSRKLVLAYMSIGEAEDYRWYWQENWDSDHDGNPEEDAPSWLGLSNPEWFGNYKVRYWDQDWKPIVYGYIDRVVEAGFDGIYLDIIDAYEYWGPGGESGLDRTSAEQDMVDFVIDIASYAREISGDPEFGVFPQNGDALASHPEYLDAVTGIGREDLWTLDDAPQFESDVQEGIANLDKFKQAGKLVLVTDYPTDNDLIESFYSSAVARGYVPYAAVRDLDELIERYPPSQAEATEDYPAGIQTATVSDLSITDLNGSDLEAATRGSPVILSLNVQNHDVNEERPFLLILEVRDELGITTSVLVQEGTLNPDGGVNVKVSWTPEEIGGYVVRSFVISNLQNPEILSPLFQQSIRIV